MPKNLLQDVKIKHSVSPKAQVMEVRRKEPIQREQREILPTEKSIKPSQQTHKSRYMFWLVAAVSVLFFLFALSYFFLKVVVTVNPKTVNAILNENLSASKNSGEEVLPFDLIVLSGEEEKTLEAKEEKDVIKKAEGIVVIYNTFSSANQLLSIDTRLEGSNGKIYKTKKQIIIPGMKGSEPGSIEVDIYGAEAGGEYNSGPLDFTIFGFKGTPKYTKFYARSKGSISGGLIGKVPFVSDVQKESAQNDLKNILEQKLFKKAADQIPKGFILFKDGVFLDINESNIDFASSKDKMLPMKIRGTLYGFLFDEAKLTKKIAEKNIKDYDGSPVSIDNIRDLTFTLAHKENISFADVKKIDFNLKGSARVVWKLDENKFVSDLVGKSKKDFKQILLKYPNIESADLEISPFWKMSLPDKSRHIKLIVNKPK